MADEAKKETIQPAPATAAETAKPVVSVDSTVPPRPAAQQGSPFMEMMPFFAGILMLMYFLVLRPDKKRREQQDALMKQMKKSDEVVLAGIGIYGTVADITGDDVVLIIDKKKDVRIKVRKEAIASIVTEEKK